MRLVVAFVVESVVEILITFSSERLIHRTSKNGAGIAKSVGTGYGLRKNFLFST
jgi:hypothetical protein